MNVRREVGTRHDQARTTMGLQIRRALFDPLRRGFKALAVRSQIPRDLWEQLRGQLRRERQHVA